MVVFASEDVGLAVPRRGLYDGEHTLDDLANGLQELRLSWVLGADFLHELFDGVAHVTFLG